MKVRVAHGVRAFATSSSGPRSSGVEGDERADARAHGAPEHAVYAYAEEDLAWWTTRLSQPFGPAAFGENLTVRGIDVNGAVVGERWRAGAS